MGLTVTIAVERPDYPANRPYHPDVRSVRLVGTSLWWVPTGVGSLGWAPHRRGSGFPYGTLIANVSGSFILAFFITLATQRFSVAPEWRLLIAIGFVGGYTTFSSFSVESIGLAQAGSWLLRRTAVSIRPASCVCRRICRS